MMRDPVYRMLTALLCVAGMLMFVHTHSQPVFAEEPLDPTSPQAAGLSVYVPLVIGGGSSSGSSPEPVTPDNPFATEIQQVVDLTNQERATAGCAPLVPHDLLMQAAQEHSTEMATYNYNTHEGLDGSLPWDRIAELGYSYGYVAENIAFGPPTASGAMDIWMNSVSGHREAILNCTFQHIGVGVAYNADSDYGYYWTQTFASPR